MIRQKLHLSLHNMEGEKQKGEFEDFPNSTIPLLSMNLSSLFITCLIHYAEKENFPEELKYFTLKHWNKVKNVSLGKKILCVCVWLFFLHVKY